jgi:DNA-binding transcriptional LysR family regulator
MELDQLECIIEVASQKHFTRAAENLNISQSSLSQKISKLEDELGIKLFERSTRTIYVTPIGLEFIEISRNILKQAKDAKAMIAAYNDLNDVTLHVGVIAALNSIGFSDIVAAYRKERPSVKMNFREDGSVKLIECLRKNEVDLAFLVMPLKNQFPDVNFQVLGSDEYVLAMHQNHPLSSRKVVSLKEVADEPFVFYSEEQSSYYICLDACEKAGFTPKIVCQSNHSPTNLALVASGVGLSFFPLEKIQKNPKLGLTYVNIKERIYKKIAVAILSKREHSLPVRIFYNYCLKYISEHGKEKKKYITLNTVAALKVV